MSAADGNPLALTRGNLDFFTDVDGHGVVGGFHLPLDSEPATDWRVRIGGKETRVLAAVPALPSPDVLALPHCRELPHAGNCRFYLHVEQDFAGTAPHTLVEVLPATRRGPTLGIRAVYRPETPRPDDAAIASIGGGYEYPAHEYLTYAIDLGGLRPDANVLDLGCGIGRMALGLSAFLRGGTYLGLDVMQGAIDVARRTFAAFPAFGFRHLDVRNGTYNPSGAGRATDVRLRDQVGRPVDFLLMASLLTHLFRDDARHYLAEAREVLAPDGVLFATAWIVTDRSGPLVRAGRSEIRFHDQGGYWIESERNPEGAIAHELEFLTAAFAAAGLRCERLIEGFWAGEMDRLAYQDLLLLRPA